MIIAARRCFWDPFTFALPNCLILFGENMCCLFSELGESRLLVMCLTGKSGEWALCHDEWLGLSGFWHWWALAACFSSLRKGRMVHTLRSSHVWQQYARAFERLCRIFLPQKSWHSHHCLALGILFNTLFFSLERTYGQTLPLCNFAPGLEKLRCLV